MKRIAITGSPGVGKSTACRKVLSQLNFSYGGMISADIRIEGERVGFEIQDIATGEVGVLSHKEGTGPRVGKYHVNLEDLDNIGVKAIEKAMGFDLIVIDEIAPMEFKSPAFIKAVEETLGSDTNMLVVLHSKSSHPLAQRIRDEFEVYTVTLENRSEVVFEIVNRFRTY